jgi:hypothetical protein
MNQAETQLVEAGWAALVERLGLAEATRFVMLLDRRTGGAIQHLHYIRSGTPSPVSHRAGDPHRHSVAASRTNAENRWHETYERHEQRHERHEWRDLHDLHDGAQAQ